MRRWMSIAKLSALEAVALVVVSCGAATQSPQSLPSPSAEDGQIENSGKRLSGDFVVNTVEDAYSEKNARAQVQMVLSFNENGNVKRQDKSRVDEGAYMINTRGELVIYIEKVNGEPLAAARTERYAVIDQRDDAITLQSGPSRKLVLRKR